MPPRFLGGEFPDVKNKDRRAVLAEWMAEPNNPFFSRNVVNIVWEHFFGVGIVDPVDDVRISNPPSNPELLDELARRFAHDYSFDLKRLVSDIVSSSTYQRTTRANASNASDMKNFAKANVRRKRAEVMLDTVSQVLEVQNKFEGLPLGSRAVEIGDGRITNYFLETFGRASRESVCSCEVTMEPSLSQALHLLNGDTVTKNLKDGPVIKNWVKSNKSPTEVVNEIYIRTVTRTPTAEESKQILKQIEEAKANGMPIGEIYEDVFWAILNSKEFMFNH